MRAVRRYWGVALAAGLVAGLASWWSVSQLTQTTYTADGIFIVPTATAAQELAGSRLPVSPYEAEGLAQTYSLLLVDDTQLLDAVSTTTGTTVDDLRESTVAENLPSTPAIRVTYTAGTEAGVRDYFDGLEEVLSTTGSLGLPPGNLRALSLPGDVESLNGLQPVAPVVALVAGLIVGLAGAVLLERSNRRVDDAEDVRDLTSWPVFEVSGGSTGVTHLGTAALRLSRSGRDEIAVVTTAAAPAGLPVDLAARLDRLDFPAGPGTTWLAAGQTGTDGHAEQEAALRGAALLAVTTGSPATSVEQALRSLADAGVQEVVVLVGERPALSRTGVDEHGGEASGTPLHAVAGHHHGAPAAER